ncbi:hypothetical protein [Agrococcus sp. ARC_14]|uniref:hypothetical protein n=1 Tax=Agrococcus sp. ARC_14 TaxID=2919927 RepID=UPI001F06102D|nr:hypothetical protein [Agrococcus sp. ARC_14]MCH1883512.1 hypothetical protein [Agrococcus sp. ARC_14]
MNEQPEREPTSSADAEARRRKVVLAELRRRRSRRRWTVGLSSVAATALIASGSVIAWSSQARAGDLAGQIEAWHEEHDLASCELAVRVVSAVGLERRAQDVLDAASHVGGADWVLPEHGRTAFAQDRDAILRTIADGGFVTDEDRELADSWESRAAASADPVSYDVLQECLTAAAAEREPIEGVTAERADALARELRALGDPRDFDDARIDRLEAAVAHLKASAAELAAGRTGFDDLRAELELAPEGALASLQQSDAHLAAVLGVLGGDHTASDVLDLVEGITLHVASVWMAEAWQLEALGDQDAAAARAAAAQQTRDAIANAAPRPVTDQGTTRPTPTVPPREESPAPVPSTPGPSTPRPTAPTPPPTTPSPTTPAPTPDPAPSDPPPGPDPSHEPVEPPLPEESDAALVPPVGPSPPPSQIGEGTGP